MTQKEPVKKQKTNKNQQKSSNISILDVRLITIFPGLKRRSPRSESPGVFEGTKTGSEVFKREGSLRNLTGKSFFLNF